MAREFKQAAKSPEQVCPLMAGLAITSVRLMTSDGAEVDLAALVKEKPAVIVFYCGGW